MTHGSLPSARTNLSDGVYIGVNVPFENGAKAPHPWVEIVQDHTPQTFEYGPDKDSFLRSKSKEYRNSDHNAVALFRVNAPPGMNQADFIDRAFKAGRRLDQYLGDNTVPYNFAFQANCDTAAQCLFCTLGGSVQQFQDLTNRIPCNLADKLLLNTGAATPEISAAVHNAVADIRSISQTQTDVQDTMLAPFADKIGLHITPQHDILHEPTPSHADYADALTRQVWKILQPEPAIPYPGCGTATITQLERVIPAHAANGTADAIWVVAKSHADQRVPNPRPGPMDTSSVTPPSLPLELATTQMSPERLARALRLDKAIRESMAAGMHQTAPAPSVDIEQNGTTARRTELPPTTGRIIGLRDTAIRLQTANGQIVAINHFDALRASSAPLEMQATLQTAIKDQEPRVISFADGNFVVHSQNEHAQQLALAQQQRSQEREFLKNVHER